MSKLASQLSVVAIGASIMFRVFNELLDAKVVTVCDSRRERLDEVARRFPGIGLTTSLNDALQTPGVDAVVICTSASSHYQLVRQSLCAGKSVLVEKPIATTPWESQELVELAEMKGLTLMVGHTFLYNDGVRLTKQQLFAANMGKIYYLYSCRTNLGPVRQDVNAVWDLAPHDISIFNYLLDDVPVWVSAVGLSVLSDTREDVGFITLGYNNNVIGNIHVSWADPNKVRELVVVGSRRRIVFDDLQSIERVKIYEKGITPAPAEASTFGEYQFQIRDGDIFSPRVEVSEPLKNQCSHYLDCLQHGLRPLTDGRAGLAVVQVLTAIEESIAHNGAPVGVNSTPSHKAFGRNGTSWKPMMENLAQ